MKYYEGQNSMEETIEQEVISVIESGSLYSHLSIIISHMKNDSKTKITVMFCVTSLIYKNI